MASWSKICCPVDFSETSRAALDEAVDLAAHFGAELALLHVFEVAPTMVSPPEVFERTVRELERKLELWRAEAERRGASRVRSTVANGVPAAEIVRFAREGGHDLVVMGTHGRRGLRHLVLGSVAERVVREAHCPVLVVRPAPR